MPAFFGSPELTPLVYMATGLGCFLVAMVMCCVCAMIFIYGPMTGCPCNNKRGRAQLLFRGNAQVEKMQIMGGVTIYKGPRSPEESNSPRTPRLLNRYASKLFRMSREVTHPLPGNASKRSTCIYVVPNDGSEPSNSWHKRGEAPKIPSEETPADNMDFEEIYDECVDLGENPPKRNAMVTSLDHQSIKCYFGDLSRTAAENILSLENIPGAYLLRDTSYDADVCLSILAPEGRTTFRHLVIVKGTDGRFKIDSLPAGSETFVSMNELIQFYSDHEIHFEDGGLSMVLISAILVKSTGN